MPNREVLRTSVTPEEKELVKKRADELGLSEAELVRSGLKKMGVKINVEKLRGAGAHAKRTAK